MRNVYEDSDLVSIVMIYIYIHIYIHVYNTRAHSPLSHLNLHCSHNSLLAYAMWESLGEILKDNMEQSRDKMQASNAIHPEGPF